VFFLVIFSISMFSSAFTVVEASAESEPVHTTSVSITPGTAPTGCEETNECFLPYRIIIQVGEIVTWKNDDISVYHMVVSGTPNEGPDGNFNSGIMSPGETISLSFQEVGEFPYYDQMHPWMIGSVIVTDANLEEETSNQVIQVHTDKTTYDEGDVIVVSGSGIDSGTIRIINPHGDNFLIENILVNNDNTFSINYEASGNDWIEEGEYIFVIISNNQFETTSIQFTGKDSPVQVIPEPEPTPVPEPDPTPEPEPTPVPEPDPTPAPGTNTVIVPSGAGHENNQHFSPTALSINVGETVTWKNSDSAAHTVTSGNRQDGPDGNFDSSLVFAGNSFSHTFKEDGTFEYFCMVHPWEFNGDGVIIVGDTGGGTILDNIPPKILQPKDIVVDASGSNGSFVTYEVLAIDNEDGIVKPSCNPSSGSLFSIGDTKVVCSAFDSSGNTAPQKSFLVTVNAPSLLIPNWIKDVAAFWCDDKIDDASFIEGIQYLIENGIIIVQATTSGSSGTQEIPSWVKNNACWWSQGLIADEDFASGLKYLIEIGVIKI